MNHDEVVTLLAEDPCAPLPPAAHAHVAACAECGALARTLEVLAEDADESDASPPAAYWDAFDARLEQRLPEAAPSRSSTRAWLAAAAATLVAIAAFGLLHEPETRPGAGPAESAGLIARITQEDAESVLDAARSLTEWSPAADPEAMEGFADAGESLASPRADDVGWTAHPLSDPLARLEDELSSLDSDQSRALAARLEEELKS